jgi:hypothetical protein
MDSKLPGEAAAGGTYGWGAYIGILHSVEQNCLLVEFSDEQHTLDRERFMRAAGGIALPDQRQQLLALFDRTLTRRLRLVPDAQLPSKTTRIDVVIQTRGTISSRDAQYCEYLDSFSGSAFEERRSQAAIEGVFSDGLSNVEELLNKCFSKAFRFATSLDIYDGSLGKNYNSNYERTLKLFLDWLQSSVLRPEELIINIHCEIPREGLPSEVHQSIAAIFQQTGWAGRGNLKFYRKMLHDRFVLCNYAAFEIGRGLDFVDDFGALRDISVHLKSPSRLRCYLAGKDKLHGAQLNRPL